MLAAACGGGGGGPGDTSQSIVLMAGDGGSVASLPALSCSGGKCTGQVQGGAHLSIAAYPADGYRFVKWTGSADCDGKTSSQLSFTVSNGVSCTAAFVRVFTVTASTETAGATATVTSGECTGVSCVADQGQTVTFHASEPPDGYRFTGWAGDAGCTGDAPSLTVVVAADTRCRAQYVRRLQVTATIAGAEGTIGASSPSGGACDAGACAIDAGGEVILVAPDLPERRFTGWSGDPGCTGTSPTLDLTNVQSTMSCTAAYVKRVTVTGVIPAGLPGRVIAASSAPFKVCDGSTCTVDQGSTVSMTADGIDGYWLHGWAQAGCPSPGRTTMVASASTVCTTVLWPFVVASIDSDEADIIMSGTTTERCSHSDDHMTATCAAAPGATMKVRVDLSNTNRPVGSWSGACTGGATGEITFTVTGPATCAAKTIDLWSRSYRRAPPAGTTATDYNALTTALPYQDDGTLLVGVNGQGPITGVWLLPVDNRNGGSGLPTLLDFSSNALRLTFLGGVAPAGDGFAVAGTGNGLPMLFFVDGALRPAQSFSYPWPVTSPAPQQDPIALVPAANGQLRMATRAVTSTSAFTRLTLLGPSGAVRGDVSVTDMGPACNAAARTEPQGIVELGDGSTLLVEQAVDGSYAVMARIAGTNVQWARRVTFAGGQIDVGGVTPVAATDDRPAGILVAGQAIDTAHDFRQAFVLWLDENGASGFGDGTASKITGRDPSFKSLLEKAVLLPSGAILASGSSTKGTNTDAIAILLDGNDGHIIADRRYGNENSERLDSGIPLPDGGYLLAGSMFSGASGVLWTVRVGGDLAIEFLRDAKIPTVELDFQPLPIKLDVATLANPTSCLKVAQVGGQQSTAPAVSTAGSVVVDEHILAQ